MLQRSAGSMRSARGRVAVVFNCSAKLPAPRSMRRASILPRTTRRRSARTRGLVLSIERAQLEAANGHLDRAARAAGLVPPEGARFGAADLALLAETVPTRARPALFGFLPFSAVPRGPWIADAFGDDLAWMAAIRQPALPLTAPMPRRLHVLWRQIFEGTLKSDAPEIAALGPAAVTATTEMMKELSPSK